MGVVKLDVGLDVIVCLVGVIPDISVVVQVLPCAVVPAVLLILLKVYSIPGDAASLLPVKEGEPQGIALSKPAQDAKERCAFNVCPADVSVRVTGREEKVHIPSSGKKAGGCLRLEHPCAEGSG